MWSIPHRAAPPPPGAADILRPEPYRRAPRADRPPSAAGHGSGARRTDRRGTLLADCAWSDKAQQVTPQGLAYICRNLVIRETNATTESLTELRSQIDKAGRRTARTALAAYARLARYRAVQEKAQHARVAGAALRGTADPAGGSGRPDGYGPGNSCVPSCRPSTRSRSGSRWPCWVSESLLHFRLNMRHGRCKKRFVTYF